MTPQELVSHPNWLARQLSTGCISLLCKIDSLASQLQNNAIRTGFRLILSNKKDSNSDKADTSSSSVWRLRIVLNVFDWWELVLPCFNVSGSDRASIGEAWCAQTIKSNASEAAELYTAMEALSDNKLHFVKADSLCYGLLETCRRGPSQCPFNHLDYASNGPLVKCYRQVDSTYTYIIQHFLILKLV
jgi:hypothetical protein